MIGTEYICCARFDQNVPDLDTWEAKLLEIGLEREAFSLTTSPTGKLTIRFWEPSRPEALQILAKLDAMPSSSH